MNQSGAALAEQFLASPLVDDATKNAILEMSPEARITSFGGYMSFGTAGLRAKMQPGTAFINMYTVAHATAGIAKYICNEGRSAMERGVVIAYDSRIDSAAFALRCAQVLSAYHIKVYLFSELRPTPVLSFALRYLTCHAGINITASHNPKEYNGYKVYWTDGAQIGADQANAISAEIAALDILEDVPSPEQADATLILPVPPEVDAAYIDCVLAERVNPQAIPEVSEALHVVYTPLHGAGITMVPQVLRRAGVKHLHIVEAQSEPDGMFPTVAYPNPEEMGAYALGQQLAAQIGSDLIIATDPDSDRVGVMARDSAGVFRHITGNQMGALLLEYIVTAHQQNGSMPQAPYAVKTIVTSNLSTEICRRNGVALYEVLTGFKYIGEIVKQQLETGGGTFLLGFEESYGFLKGTYTRDKDAVVTSMLICEMAAFYKAQGKTLYDALLAVFQKYGVFLEKTLNFYFDTPDGQEKIGAIMKHLRGHSPESLAGESILSIRDYSAGVIRNAHTGETAPTGLPVSDILYFETAHCTAVVRPSGTEPKLKIYLLAHGKEVSAVEQTITDFSAAMHALMDGGNG